MQITLYSSPFRIRRFSKTGRRRRFNERHMRTCAHSLDPDLRSARVPSRYCLLPFSCWRRSRCCCCRLLYLWNWSAFLRACVPVSLSVFNCQLYLCVCCCVGGRLVRICARKSIWIIPSWNDVVAGTFHSFPLPLLLLLCTIVHGDEEARYLGVAMQHTFWTSLSIIQNFLAIAIATTLCCVVVECGASAAAVVVADNNDDQHRSAKAGAAVATSASPASISPSAVTAFTTSNSDDDSRKNIKRDALNLQSENDAKHHLQTGGSSAVVALIRRDALEMSGGEFYGNVKEVWLCAY